jgi:hypothetical protein
MMSGFEQVLSELGSKLGIALKPDHNQSCLLEINGVRLQIDLESDGDEILLGSFLGQLTPGPYRSKVFTEALKRNGNGEASQGILAFTRKNDSLVLFQYLPLTQLTGDILYTHLLEFLEHASIWIESLQRGDLPIFQESV